MSEQQDTGVLRRSPARLIVSALIGGLVVISLCMAVIRNWSDVKATWTTIEPHELGSSFLCLLVALAATWWQWRIVLTSYGVTIAPRESAEVFFVSQLGKYAPGSVWPILIQARGAQRHGARPATVVAANLVVLVVSLAVGLVVAGLTLPFVDAATLRRFWWTLLAVPLLVALLHPAVVPWVLNRWLKRRGQQLQSTPSRRSTLHAAAWSVVAWAGYGGHVYLLGAAQGAGFLALCTGAIALAYCAGILFVPAPAGAGIREIVLVAALSTTLTLPQSLALAVASRVLFLAADLAAAGVSMVRRPT